MATVSNVLTGKTGEVSAGTIERVLRKVKELGYMKDVDAFALGGQPYSLLAVVFPGIALSSSSSEVGAVNPYYGDFVLCLEREAAAHGFDLMVSSGRADPNRPLHYVMTRQSAFVTRRAWYWT